MSEEKGTKKQILLLVILILIIAGLIIAILMTKGKTTTGGGGDKTDDVVEEGETQEKLEEVAKIIDLDRTLGFLNSFGWSKLNLAESSRGRLLLIEQAVLDDFEDVDYSSADDGYILIYGKIEDFKEQYERVFGGLYDFEKDLMENREEFYDCSGECGEGIYGFKKDIDDNTYKSLTNTLKITGDNGNYNLNGTAKVILDSEEDVIEKQYKIEFQDYHLKNLIIE